MKMKAGEDTATIFRLESKIRLGSKSHKNETKMSSEKHDLTPSSKDSAFQSKKKRMKDDKIEKEESVKTPKGSCNVENQDESNESFISSDSASSATMSCSSSTVGLSRKSLDYSGAGIKKRQKEMREILTKHFKYSEGAGMGYSVVEKVLTKEGLQCPSKSVIACIKKTFPGTDYSKFSKKVTGISKLEHSGDAQTEDEAPPVGASQGRPGRTATFVMSEGDFEKEVSRLLRKQSETVAILVDHFQESDPDTMQLDESTQERVKVDFFVEQIQEELESITSSLVKFV